MVVGITRIGHYTFITYLSKSNHDEHENIQTPFVSSDFNCKHELCDVYVRLLSSFLTLYNAKKDSVFQKLESVSVKFTF